MADNFPSGSISVALPPSLGNAIQDRTLQRTFRDTLYPRLLYRMEAVPELWAANLGTNQTFTRPGLIKPRTRPIEQNKELTPKKYDIEQWEATAQQWGDTIDTHMPTSYVTMASTYLRNMHQLGLQAGQSINRVVRDKGFNAYVAGNTVNDTAGIAAAATLHVININGFVQKLADGRPAPVSVANPGTITVPGLVGGDYTATYTGVTPDTASDNIKGGLLTGLSPVIPAGGIPVRSAVLEINRSELVYSGGGNSVDDIAATDQFTLADVRAMISKLRFNNIPTHEDQMFHIHLDPISVSQIYNDNEFQRLNQSLPDYVHYKRFAIGGPFLNSVFYSNTEAPFVNTVDSGPDSNTHGFELVNAAGINLHRPIATGLGWIEEKFLDESKYISDAGVMGRIGEFSVTNNGMAIMTERIRLVLRSPLDRLQQQVATSWSISGDWPVPSDQLGAGSVATFKRAVVTVHGE